PRYAFGAYNGLANRRLQPLGHVSGSGNAYRAARCRSRQRPWARRNTARTTLRSRYAGRERAPPRALAGPGDLSPQFPPPLPQSQPPPEVELAKELPAPERRNRKRRPDRHVPIVQRDSAHELVAARTEIAMLPEVLNIVLDQDQPRPVARDREA